MVTLLETVGAKACDVGGISESDSVSVPSRPSVSLSPRVLFPRAETSGSGLDRNMASSSACSSGVRIIIAPSLRRGRGWVAEGVAAGKEELDVDVLLAIVRIRVE